MKKLEDRTSRPAGTMRELTGEEAANVSGGVHLGSIADRIAQYLWARMLQN